MTTKNQNPRNFRALATDGDGTLSRNGALGADTLAALRRLRQAGRKLLLVTGEPLEEACAFPDCELFHRVVAENGAVLYRPETGKTRVLGDPPPKEFLNALRKRGVKLLSIGQVVVGMHRSAAKAVREEIARANLRAQVIFNRRNLMCLPEGVNKATGLAAALAELHIDESDVVGIGDAENDVDLLDFCGVGVAVHTAVRALKTRADVVTKGGAGRGVVELVERFFPEVSNAACGCF